MSTAPSRLSKTVLRGKALRFDHLFMLSSGSHKPMSHGLLPTYISYSQSFFSWHLSKQGNRVFIKDMAYYLVPPEGMPAQIAPSLGGRVKKGVGTNGYSHTNGVTNGHTNGLGNGPKSTPYPYNTEAEHDNPTVVPSEILKQFHFVFLIRHPRHGIPSHYHCTIPPLDQSSDSMTSCLTKQVTTNSAGSSTTSCRKDSLGRLLQENTKAQ
jgi:hypothetical protein